MPWEDVEARKEQAVIDANKKFIKCAKKMALIAYGKVDVSPDPSAPLKKSIGTYKTAWYDIYFKASLREVRKRKYDYQDHYSRYQYEAYCSAYLLKDHRNYDGTISAVIPTGCKWRLGKFTVRSPKKFLSTLRTIEELIDNSIRNEDIKHNEIIARKKLLTDARARIKGLQFRDGSFYIGEHEVNNSNSWGNVSLNDDGQIRVRELTISVDQFNEFTKMMGWRKEETNA